MNEEKKESLNMGQEYGTSITEGLTYERYLGNVAWVLDNFNPVKRILVFRSDMPDESSKKLIDDFVKADIPTFLATSRKVCENCLAVGYEISEIAKALSIKRKETIGK